MANNSSSSITQIVIFISMTTMQEAFETTVMTVSYFGDQAQALSLSGTENHADSS